jgi:hypothetical protein
VTRRRWLLSLRARGISLRLEGPRDYLRVRGSLTVADRKRLQIERAAIVALLQRRRARQRPPEPMPLASLPEGRQVIGERLLAIGGAHSARQVVPLYADEALGVNGLRVVSAPTFLQEAADRVLGGVDVWKELRRGQ